MWKFKSFQSLKSMKGRDKWLFLLTMGAALCILAFPVGGGRGKAQAAGLLGSIETKENDVGELSGSGNPLVGSVAGGTVLEQTTFADNAAIPVSARTSESYECQLEERVKALLKDVEGVGEVEVLIVLKSTSEKVIHTAGNHSYSTSEEQNADGTVRRSEESQQEANAVLTSADGADSPIIEKELYPELSGIVISAAGGGSPAVQAEISAAMEALFGLPANKIKVLKRVE